MVKLQETSQGRPNIEALLDPLKDFQRHAVDHAFKQLFREGGSGRFLIADEVGLGKTLVARGVIARAIERMWDSVGRIDVVYVCSNAAIANANIARLAVGDHEMLPATRLTLLPQQLREMRQRRLVASKEREPKVLFCSFSPGTALETQGTGRADERLVLYSLMCARFGKQAWVANVLQVGVGDKNWRSMLGWAPDLDDSMVEKFHDRIDMNDGLQNEIADVRTAFARQHNYSDEIRRHGNRLVGRLRQTLAEACIDELEPDLVVLDEFQRFKHLLGDEEEQDDVNELARQLFHYKAPEGHDVKLLLLSATPYRMYTTDWESEEEDHYEDFIATTGFLMKDPARLERFKNHLAGYRTALRQLALQPQTVNDSEIMRHRDDVQRELRSVMSRSERVRSTCDRESMVLERPQSVRLDPSDLAQYALADAIAEQVGHPAPVEYWKSAPYLPNFMPDYVLKKRLVENLGNPEMAAALQPHRNQFVRQNQVGDYKQIDPANSRLRAIMEEFLGNRRAELLWVPPTLPYWPLGGPFTGNEDFTKGLVFSAWRVVPDAVSAVMSYEAERESADVTDVTYKKLHEKRSGRLTLQGDAGPNMTTFALLIPSLKLADAVRPTEMWRRGDAVRELARARVEELLRELPEGEGDGGEDRKWYWAAPLLLDRHQDVVERFLNKWEAPGDPKKVPAAFTEGRLRALDAMHGGLKLGRRPAELVEVLTDLALGAPGTVAARSLRAFDVDDADLLQSAATIADGFRSLFNQPTAMGIVRRRYGSEEEQRVPYWRAVTKYCQDGCLQALLDEQMHLEWEQASWQDDDLRERARRVATVVADAASIKTSHISVDTFTFSQGRVRLNDPLRMRTAFALRYAAVTGDDGSALAREDAVRTAFNSPFQPFVLVTTSVGQEGLDFHPWCHAVYHWNLPGNPVDLEQREGRVHRYKGHALRRNVAAAHESVLRSEWDGAGDPWAALFAAARRVAAAQGKSEMVPYWVHEGPHKVERRVLSLPFSMELDLLARLKRSLALYRVVFGQPRQQELLELLERANLTEEQLERCVLDLSADAPPIRADT